MDEESFTFGSFRVIPAQRMLLEDGKPLRLGSRALDILIYPPNFFIRPNDRFWHTGVIQAA
jgi:hypothetical protein